MSLSSCNVHIQVAQAALESHVLVCCCLKVQLMDKMVHNDCHKRLQRWGPGVISHMGALLEQFAVPQLV
jgi:hypothetical protein